MAKRSDKRLGVRAVMSVPEYVSSLSLNIYDDNHEGNEMEKPYNNFLRVSRL
jgi:hypothetical protein